ncbi:MAG: glycerol kinase GlpK [Armatimonadota bacterium]|nr:MAG: glycerol kinase GlpK [Armatimonadota bacterium]
MGLILAIDQGTTGTTAVVVGDDGAVRGTGYAPVVLSYPRPGWVEQDAEAIWDSVAAPVQSALDGARAKGPDLAGVGITNQRETVVLWERATGRPVLPAIVWQCRRTTDICRRLRAEGHEPRIAEKTGLVLDPYFSATKIQWALEAHPELRARSARGEIRAGTVDSWLIWKLSGGSAHVTDASNASRTMLLDIGKAEWDDQLLATFGVPHEILPQVVASSGVIAETADTDVLPAGIPIAGIAGDQQAALFGQGCFSRGLAKNTYGTGCFLLLNAGQSRPPGVPGILTTIAWLVRDQPTYAYEGSVFIAGALLQWLRDEMGIISDAAESDALARSVPDTAGTYIVPAFVGLGAPYWEPAARGTIVGLTRGTSRAHIARAALEAIAYEVRDLVEAMTAAPEMRLAELRADGGAAANDFLLQFQADITDVPVQRAATLEATSLGAAYLAGLGVGVWQSLEALSGLSRPARRFEPAMDAAQRGGLVAGWRRAVRTALAWAQAEPARGEAMSSPP